MMNHSLIMIAIALSFMSCRKSHDVIIVENPLDTVIVETIKQSYCRYFPSIPHVMYSDYQGENYSYAWSTKDTTDHIYIEKSGTYSVTVFDNMNRSEHNIVQTIELEVCHPNLYIPDMFSPHFYGSDNVLFSGKGAFVKRYHMIIYNQRNRVMYETGEYKVNDNGDILEGWDGRNHNGSECLAGYYTYYIDVSFHTGKNKSYTGQVLLIR